MSVVVNDAISQRPLGAAAGVPPLPPARQDLRLLPDAPLSSDPRRRTTARRSTAVSLRDPVVRAEVIGDPRVRASVSGTAVGRDGVTDGPGGSAMSKYGRRRPTSLEQGDCPPSPMPFDYNDASFVAAAQRVGRHLHICWIDQALGDVVLLSLIHI